LRFTLSEAQAFLVRTMGLDLSAQDIGQLEERTEGWAAGMQLAALALDELSNEEDRRAFIEAFTGSNRMIVDYLISRNLVWARVQIALGHFKDASTFIGPALQAARECGLLFRVAELSIAQALIYDGHGDSSTAQDTLEQALAIAEACRYTRFFDDGPELERLLQKVVERKVHAQYARGLLASFQTRRTKRTTAKAALKGEKERSTLVDPLSERELEVLRLLAAGLPPAEVAKKVVPFSLYPQSPYPKHLCQAGCSQPH